MEASRLASYQSDAETSFSLEVSQNKNLNPKTRRDGDDVSAFVCRQLSIRMKYVHNQV